MRTAHYWTRLHPELVFEDDVKDLLATHEILAECILKDPEAQKDALSQQAAAELASLRKLRQQHKSMAQAFQELSLDHQYSKHHLHESEENLRELDSSHPPFSFLRRLVQAVTQRVGNGFTLHHGLLRLNWRTVFAFLVQFWPLRL